MKTKGRLLSFFLAVLMVASVLTVFQPLVAEATEIADVKCTFSPKEKYTMGGKFSFSGKITSDHNISKVTVGIYDLEDQGNVDRAIQYFSDTVEDTEFRLSNVPSFYIGEVLDDYKDGYNSIDTSDNYSGILLIIYVSGENIPNGYTSFEYEISFEELDSPDITSPDDDEIFYEGDDVLFKWSSVSEATGYEWKLYEGTTWDNKVLKTGSTGTSLSSRKVTIDGSVFKANKIYTFSVKAYNDYSTSTGKIFVFNVSVKPNELYADPEELGFTSGAGRDTIDLTSTHEWDAYVSDDWFWLSHYDGSGDDTLTVYVEENTGDYRVGVITIESNGQTIYIDVLQNRGTPLQIEVTPELLQVDYTENQYSFFVATNVIDWSVSSDDSWINGVTNSSFDGDSWINFSVDENTGTQSRTGTITITGGGITKTFTVIQDGRPAMRGDLNGDAQITNKDRFILNRFLEGMMTVYAGIDMTVADINGDGEVTKADAEYLSRYLAHWDGYEEIPAISTGSTECSHVPYKDYYSGITHYISNTIKTNMTHTYYHVWDRTCNNCGHVTKVQGETITEQHSYNASGLCVCGAYSNPSFIPWIGVNASGKSKGVYNTPNATINYGYINMDEVVTVIGEYGDCYLIEYKLDNGKGIKQGYVIKSGIEKQKIYSIYIDDEYFIEKSVFNDGKPLYFAEYGTVCPLKVFNHLTHYYESYVEGEVIIESSNTEVATINRIGQLIIHSVGDAELVLKYGDTVIDTVEIVGCNYFTRYNTDDIMSSNFSSTSEQGYCMIPGRVIMYDYGSRYVKDPKWEGGGYHLVTFNLYNSSPTTFSVASYNKDGTIREQKLIKSFHAGGMFDEMWLHLRNMDDIVNGDLLKGKSEMMSQKTPIELKVPLGGFISFVPDSDYAVKANVIEIIMHAMGTVEGVSDILGALGKASIDTDLFYKKLAELTGMTEVELTLKAFEILTEKEDMGDLLAAFLGMIFDEGVTADDIMSLYLECAFDALPKALEYAGKLLLEAGLNKIPPAKIITGVVDSLSESVAIYRLSRDMLQLSRRETPFLTIQCPTIP